MDYLSPTLYLTDIFIIFIFLFYFPRLIVLLKKIKRKYLLIFCLFLVSLVLGLVDSKNPLAGIYGITKLFEFIFLTLFVLDSYKSFNRKIIFFCFLFGIVFESLLSFLQYFNQGSIGGIFYYFGERAFNSQTPGIANASINGQLFLRSYATLPHPNVLAGFLLIAMLYLFLLFPALGKKRYLLIGIVVGTFSLLLTLSRVAILIWVVYLLILFVIFISQKYKNKILNPKLVLGTVVMVVMIMLLGYGLQNSFLVQRFSLTRISEESLVQRQDLTKQALTMFTVNPVLGVGLNNFFNNLDTISLKTTQIQPVHNIFLLVLAETGIIGFIFFVYILYKSIASVIKKSLRKERNYLLMIVSSVIILGLFDHYFLTLQQGQILFSLILGTTIFYKRI